jgi:negative regulator of sigma E activity
MTHPQAEDLSALVDGALGKSETVFLLRRLENDAELRACYSRYHLIRDCLRNPATAMPMTGDLAGRIQLAIVQESQPGRALPWRGGLQWAAGFFTAAIVAAGAFWYVQPQDTSEALAGATTAAPGVAEVQSSGVNAADLRRQLPLLPVSARQSRPFNGEFAPQPDPETWQRAPMTPLHYPSTQYIIVVPVSPRVASDPERAGDQR